MNQIIKVFTAVVICSSLSCSQNWKEEESNILSLENKGASNEVNDNGIPVGGADSAFQTATAEVREETQPKDNLRQKYPAPLASPNYDWNKKIIKTAQLHLEVSDFSSFTTTLHEKITLLGGYVVSETQDINEEIMGADMTVKIPATAFDQFINTFASKDIVIKEKTISGEDVTSQMVDTKARIEAKKKAMTRYVQLLQNASSMQDIIVLQEEINSIQEEIESATSRLNLLQHNTAMSTVTLRYHESMIRLNNQAGFLEDIWNAFSNGAGYVRSFIIFLVGIWPLFLFVGGFALGIKKYRIISSEPSAESIVKNK
jgi:hypothetical protein